MRDERQATSRAEADKQSYPQCLRPRAGTARMASRQRGFTLIELLVVIAILGVTASIVVLSIGHLMDSGNLEAANTEAHQVQTAVYAFMSANHLSDWNGDIGPSSEDEDPSRYLLNRGSLQAVYTVTDGMLAAASYETLPRSRWAGLVFLNGMWMNLVETIPPLTSLGSTFAEISRSMIDLALEFYEENGYWPRTWGDYRFTDLGLDPLEWSGVPVEGIIYAPVGSRLQVRPAAGYEFTFAFLDGSTGSLTSTLNWNLVYSLQNNTWYFHSIAEGNEIDIDSLRVDVT
jgi:prepilin-type N-terminal cleavage/methylation domain-containing protein